MGIKLFDIKPEEVILENMKKFVITSAVQLANLLQNNPVLYQIQVFGGIKKLAEQAAVASTKKCNCSSPSGVNAIPNLRIQMETVLRNMTTEDFNQMKTLLKLDQICYYKTDNGKLVLSCL